MCEISYWKQASFLTLTYAEECLPFNKSVSKDELQRFFKRLRKNTGEKMKYFACGEYGSKNGRPHYHILLYFNEIEDVQKAVEKNWTFGNVKTGTVTESSIRYVLNYLNKKGGYKEYVFRKGRFVKNKIKKPFRIMSKNFGLEYLKENEKRISELKYMSIKGFKYRVPRYFQKKSEMIDKAFKESSEEVYHVPNSVLKMPQSDYQENLSEQVERNKEFFNSIKKRDL